MTAEGGPAREAHWVTFIGLDCNGARIEMRWKAWRYECPDRVLTTWELRRIVNDLVGRPLPQLHKEVKQLLGDWGGFLLSTGRDPGQALIRSARSEVARQQHGTGPPLGDDMAPFCRQEASATTEGIIYGLVFEASCRRTGRRRDRARALLEGFVGSFLGGEVVGRLQAVAWGNESARGCASFIADAVCEHVRGPLQRLRPGPTFPSELIANLSVIGAASVLCESARLVFASSVAIRSDSVNLSLADVSSKDPLKQHAIKGPPAA